MMISISPKSVICPLLLLTTFCLRALKPATGDACRAIEGPISDTDSFTWSIPLNPKQQAATFNVQVQNDFHLALVPDKTLSPPPAYRKYIVQFGGYSNTWCAIGGDWIYNGAVLNANRAVELWLSWAGGVIAAGTGKVVGKSKLMQFTDPSPSPVNYMLIGGYSARGNVTINYCYDFLVFDRLVPVDLPYITASELTILDCGRLCDQDPNCVGYSVFRDVLLVRKSPCNIFYFISGRQYDSQHVTYEYGNATYPTY